MRVSKGILIAGFLSLWIGWSCRGKEGPQGPQGPQGPAGQDLTRPQNGYIEGRARGKDNSGNSFNIPFRYTYYFSLGTYRVVGPDSFQIEFARAESLGIGRLSFSFSWGRNTNRVADATIGGTIADPSQNPVPTYEVRTLPAVLGFPGTTQSLSNLSLSGDTLRGNFQYIHPSHNRINIPGVIDIEANNHPDTVEGSFLVKLVRERRYNREAGQ